MPSIYVADLAAYNGGNLIGKWIDAAQEPEDILIEVQEMLQTGEEWAIHDYEGFGSIRLGEYEAFEQISMLAKLIEEYGDPFIALYNYDSYLASTYDDWEKVFTEGYIGEYESMKDYAYEYVESTEMLTKMPEWIRAYDAYARDLEIELVSVPSKSGVYIFYP